MSIAAAINAGLRRLSSGLLFPRLLVGLIVLICAEVFSGASVATGLWNPWVWCVTYWLYFAHFFFFVTLAVRTGRTSIWALYLWGVLFGLYESWITKVIWHGFSGDGMFALGSVGPYGLFELCVVFLFHPVMSFILPLTITCLICPSLRRWFPDLAWFTSSSKRARAIRLYNAISLAFPMAVNSGGIGNLTLNLAFALVLLFVLSRLSRHALTASEPVSVVVFGRRGLVALCVYLVLLYATTYIFIRPDGLPSIRVQAFTFVFYGVAFGGLRLHRRREPLPNDVDVKECELRLVKRLFALVLGLGLALSTLAGKPVLGVPIVVNFILWTPTGFILTAVAVGMGIREHFASPLRRSNPTPAA
jgi:hypothetical protein